MEKWIDFMKIKFHSNENIEWHCMDLEFQLHWLEFELNLNSRIELRFNFLKKRRIVEKIVKFVCEYGIGIYIYIYIYEKKSFNAFSLVDGPYIFQIGIW
jgi:hypothetical protein